MRLPPKNQWRECSLASCAPRARVGRGAATMSSLKPVSLLSKSSSSKASPIPCPPASLVRALGEDRNGVELLRDGIGRERRQRGVVDALAHPIVDEQEQPAWRRRRSSPSARLSAGAIEGTPTPATASATAAREAKIAELEAIADAPRRVHAALDAAGSKARAGALERGQLVGRERGGDLDVEALLGDHGRDRAVHGVLGVGLARVAAASSEGEKACEHHAPRAGCRARSARRRRRHRIGDDGADHAGAEAPGAGAGPCGTRVPTGAGRRPERTPAAPGRRPRRSSRADESEVRAKNIECFFEKPRGAFRFSTARRGGRGGFRSRETGVEVRVEERGRSDSASPVGGARTCVLSAVTMGLPPEPKSTTVALPKGRCHTNATFAHETWEGTSRMGREMRNAPKSRFSRNRLAFACNGLLKN